ncbi:Ribosome maturation factor RimP [Streptomyces hirsutus]
MSSTQSERLRELLEPLVSSQGLDLEEIAVDTVGRKRVLRVVVDSDTGADLDRIADVSRVRPRRSSTRPTRWAAASTPSRSEPRAPNAPSPSTGTTCAPRAAWWASG